MTSELFSYISRKVPETSARDQHPVKNGRNWYAACPLADYAKAERECSGNICFSWAFGALVGDGDSRKLVKIDRDTELKTGDQLKMLIKLK